MVKNLRVLLALAVVGTLALTACSSATATSVETASAQDASSVLAENSEAVVLDIRTPEEFAGPRIDGAVNIDFYAADFADQIAALDRDTTYVVYCRSGNRSGQARGVFEELGFADVTEVAGGILAWHDAGLPLDG